MDRGFELKKHYVQGIGIEIAPYFNPILPKAEYREVLILDVASTDSLRASALNDPLIDKDKIKLIDQVDLVGSACEIESSIGRLGLTGEINFIVSSHNFEHLPNPIKFLKGCSEVLKEGGVLTMAIPDCRACFDHFRSPSSLSDWLQSWADDQRQPNGKQIFDNFWVRSEYFINGKGRPEPGFSLRDHSPEFNKPVRLLKEAYAQWESTRITQQTPYVDAHCSVVTPDIMRLLLGDLQFLGIINLEILEISDTNYHEFYVHLRKPLESSAKNISEDEFYGRREFLLKRINASLGSSGYVRETDKSSFKAKWFFFKKCLQKIFGID